MKLHSLYDFVGWQVGNGYGIFNLTFNVF